MHDPCTVAFVIKSPFVSDRHRRNDGRIWKYRNPLITIWHVDPREDDCGWAWARATDEDHAFAKRLANEEFEFWMGKYMHSAQGGVAYTVHEAIWWAWKLIAMRRSGDRGPLSRSEEDRILLLAANPHDNLRFTVAHCGSLDGLEKMFLAVDRIYRTHHRPWYRHPRWHFWHWKFQVHPWQTFRRWAFTRCGHCGKRFAWGYSPTAHGWHRSSPKWFRSELGVYHHECSNVVCAMEQAERARQQGAVN